MSLKHGAATPEGIYDLKLMNTAKAGDPHSAMPIAARAADIVEGNADRRVCRLPSPASCVVMSPPLIYASAAR